MKQKLTIGIVLVVLAAAFFAPALLAGAPSGAGPTDPLMVTGNWQPLAANASAWFYFDYGASSDRSRVEVDLDANGAGNIALAIFTPAQGSAWLNDPTTKPVGIGTLPGSASAASIHDLVWLGAFNTSGRYFAVVTNGNASPISYRLLVNGASVTLAPPPTATPYPTPYFGTPIPTGTLQGRLLFQDASGGIIYAVNGDGTNLTRVTTGIDPAYSPDSKRIAFTRWTNPAGVYTSNADGSNEQLLFGAAQSLSPQWSPNASAIAFTQQKGGSPDSQFCFGRFGCFSTPADPHWKLGVVNVNDGTLFEPSSTAHAFAPTWSSDGTTLAFADATFGMLGTSATGGAPFNLFTQNPAVQSPIYSADGGKIVFMAKHHDHWEIDAVNADDSNVVAVTHADPLLFYLVNNVAPTWSPDGKQILFLSDRGGKWEFFVVNADGTGLTQVLKNITDSVPIRYNFSNERVIDWVK
ncbi:MAG TPA: hypothetical protein VF429_08300 [Anaerolineae bacterium]